MHSVQLTYILTHITIVNSLSSYGLDFVSYTILRRLEHFLVNSNKIYLRCGSERHEAVLKGFELPIRGLQDSLLVSVSNNIIRTVPLSEYEKNVLAKKFPFITLVWGFYGFYLWASSLDSSRITFSVPADPLHLVIYSAYSWKNISKVLVQGNSVVIDDDIQQLRIGLLLGLHEVENVSFVLVSNNTVKFNGTHSKVSDKISGGATQGANNVGLRLGLYPSSKSGLDAGKNMKIRIENNTFSLIARFPPGQNDFFYQRGGIGAGIQLWIIRHARSDKIYDKQSKRWKSFYYPYSTNGLKEVASGIGSIVLSSNTIFLDNTAPSPSFESLVSGIIFQFAFNNAHIGLVSIVKNNITLRRMRYSPSIGGFSGVFITWGNYSIDHGVLEVCNNFVDASDSGNIFTPAPGHSQKFALVRFSYAAMDPGALVTDIDFIFKKAFMTIPTPAGFDLHSFIIRENKMIAPNNSAQVTRVIAVEITLAQVSRFRNLVLIQNEIVVLPFYNYDSSSSSSSSSSSLPNKIYALVLFTTLLGGGEKTVDVTALKLPPGMSLPSGIDPLQTVVALIYTDICLLEITNTFRLVNHQVSSSSSSFSSAVVDSFPLVVVEDPRQAALAAYPEKFAKLKFEISIGTSLFFESFPIVSKHLNFFKTPFVFPSLQVAQQDRPKYMVDLISKLDQQQWLPGFGFQQQQQQQQVDESFQQQILPNSSICSKLLREENVGGLFSFNNNIYSTSSSSSSLFRFHGPQNLTFVGTFCSYSDSFTLSNKDSAANNNNNDNNNQMQLLETSPRVAGFVPTHTQLPNEFIFDNATFKVDCSSSSSSSSSSRCFLFSEETPLDSTKLKHTITTQATRLLLQHSNFSFTRRLTGDATSDSSSSFAAVSAVWASEISVENSTFDFQQTSSSTSNVNWRTDDLILVAPVTASVNISNTTFNFTGGPRSSSSSASPQQLVKLTLTSSGTDASGNTAEQNTKDALSSLLPSSSSRSYSFMDVSMHSESGSLDSADVRVIDNSTVPLRSAWRAGAAASVHCFSFNEIQKRRGARMFNALQGLSRSDGEPFFEGCPFSPSETLSETISIVPHCADFTLKYSGPSLNVPEALRLSDEGSGLRASFFLIPESIRDTPAPLAPGGRIVPDIMNPLEGVQQSEAFTQFLANRGNLESPNDLRVPTRQVTASSSVSQQQDGIGVVERVVNGSSGAPRSLTLTLRLSPAISPDSDHVAVVLVSTKLLACVAPPNMSWFEARIPITRQDSDFSAALLSASATAGGVAAVFGGPLVGASLGKAGAVMQFSECSFSMSEGSPLPFIENPFGLGYGASHGYWRRGAIVGNFLLVLLIIFLLLLIAFARVHASRRRHAKWTKKHREQVAEQEQLLRHASASSFASSSVASVAKNNNNKNNNYNSPSATAAASGSPALNSTSQSSLPTQSSASAMTREKDPELQRHASLKALKELKKEKKLNEPKILPLLDALYLAKLPATLVIPLTILVQGTVSSAVSLILGGVSVNDRLLGVFFLLLYLLWLGWFIHVVFVQMPNQPWLVYAPRAPDPRRFAGEDDPTLEAGDAERSTMMIFSDCAQCRPFLKSLKQQEEARKKRARMLKYSQEILASSSASAASVSSHQLLLAQAPRRDLLHRRPFSYYAGKLFWAVIHVYGDWQFKRPSKKSGFHDFPEDKTFFPRTADFYIQASGNTRWMLLFELVTCFIIAVVSGIQTVMADCAVNSLIVTFVSILPMIVMLLLWPAYSDRVTAVFSQFAAVIIVLMSFAVALQDALPSVEFVRVFLTYINSILSFFGLFKSAFDIIMLAMTFETWLLLPLFAVNHIIFHELFGQKWKEKRAAEAEAEKSLEKESKERRSGLQQAFLDDENEFNNSNSVFIEMKQFKYPRSSKVQSVCWDVASDQTQEIAPRGKERSSSSSSSGKKTPQKTSTSNNNHHQSSSSPTSTLSSSMSTKKYSSSI